MRRPADALWPRTTIAAAAIRTLIGGEPMERRSRTPEIMADAAHAILCRPSRETTGQFFVNDEVLAEEGVADFECYAVDPSQPLQPDFSSEGRQTTARRPENTVVLDQAGRINPFSRISRC